MTASIVDLAFGTRVAAMSTKNNPATDNQCCWHVMDMLTDMCTDMCIDMCTDMWTDMWTDMCIDMCLNRHVCVAVERNIQTCVQTQSYRTT